MHEKLHSMVLRLLSLILLISFVSCPVIALGTETLITTGTPDSNQAHPSTWGNYIVWEDQQGGNSTIVLYNVTSGEDQTISSPSAHAHSPGIQGNNVVWYETTGSDSDIFAYNTISHATTLVISSPSEKLNPVIFGNKIVWQEYLDTDGTNPYYDLQLYDLASPGQITNITPHSGSPGINSSSHEFPSIWGDTVVWQDWDDANQTYEIFSNNTANGTLTQISDSGGFGSLKYHPVISGNTILWSDYRNGDADIFTDTVLPTGNRDITPYSPSIQDLPVLSGNFVAWLDNRGHDFYYQIGLKNLTTTQETYPATPSSHIPMSFVTPPSLFSNRIVWEDDRVPGGNDDIYMYTNGVSVTCPVAGFTQNITTGSPGDAVQFTDASTPSPSHWVWNFGDGSTSRSQSPTHVYPTSGVFAITLTVGTPYCRNSTGTSPSHNVSVGSAPLVSFSGAPREGMVPLTVAFSESSSGIPTAWNWSFGDGEFSENQAPTHTYTAGGVFTVTLNATNAYGTGTLSKTAYITVTTGAHEIAFTNVTGISVQPLNSGPYLVYDKSSLPLYTLSPDKSVLVSSPPLIYGWQTITFVSSEGTGFAEDPTTIRGNLSHTILKTKDITPAGFSNRVGNNIQVNYRLNSTSYQYPGWIITDIWEGTTPSDNNNFQTIYTHSNFATMNPAYTIKMTRNNLTVPKDGTLNVSVGSCWVAGSEGLDWGRQHTFVIATGYDSDGKLKGIVFPSRYMFNDTSRQLEYFESDIPAKYAYFDTFAVARLSGSGNPFQLITLTLAEIISPPADPSSSGLTEKTEPGPVVTVNTTSPAPLTTPLADPGRSARLYLNNQGVITQKTTLWSTDGLAAVTVIEGVTAKDDAGNPLSAITIKAVPPDSLPGVSEGSAFTHDAMAYDLQPDNSTFSPSISINLTIPQAPWGRDFMVKTYDEKTGEWLDVPASYNPDNGVVTAQISHFCLFALFSRAVTPAPSAAATDVPADIPPEKIAPPAPTAMSIFSGIMLWVVDMAMKNVLFVAGLVILIVAIFLYGRKRRRDRIMYLI
jgi:beta propeller repeat protein